MPQQQTVLLHYAGTRKPARRRVVTLQSITPQHDGWAIGGWCHEDKCRKIYRANRIIDICDSETGELYDHLAMLAGMAGVASAEFGAAIKPESVKSWRTQEIDLAFVDGCLPGYAFGVGPAMRPALDILMTTYSEQRKPYKVMTRGVPPLLNFAVGDTFHNPPSAHRTPWRPADMVHRTVQVTEAWPDEWDQKQGCIWPGRVACTVTAWGPAAAEIKNWVLTQQQFLQFLQCGQVDI